MLHAEPVASSLSPIDLVWLDIKPGYYGALSPDDLSRFMADERFIFIALPREICRQELHYWVFNRELLPQFVPCDFDPQACLEAMLRNDPSWHAIGYALGYYPPDVRAYIRSGTIPQPLIFTVNFGGVSFRTFHLKAACKFLVASYADRFRRHGIEPYLQLRAIYKNAVGAQQNLTLECSPDALPKRLFPWLKMVRMMLKNPVA